MILKYLSILLFLTNLAIFSTSLKKAKKQFYTDTPWFVPFGIYVWGDGLVLAPFWMLASVIFWFLQLEQIAIFVLVFLVVRSAFEVVYWLNHQSVKSDYCPPLLKDVKWLDAEKVAILYQLTHTCVIVLGLAGISWFYQK